jgi:hypothetical protein
MSIPPGVRALNYRSGNAPPGQRQLAGIQTTGRQYRNPSTPEFAIATENSVAVPKVRSCLM